MGRLTDWLFGTEEKKRDRIGEISFKAGTRPAIILQTLCEGVALSGWSACKLLHTHNADRELRRVRRRLRAEGIQFQTFHAEAANGSKYKVTQLVPSHIPAARKLIVGKAA